MIVCITNPPLALPNQPCLASKSLLGSVETAVSDPKHVTYAVLCGFIWLLLNFPPVLYF